MQKSKCYCHRHCQPSNLAKLDKHAKIWSEDYNQEDTDRNKVNYNT